VTGWQLSGDSPLLDLVDGDRRGRFTVERVAGGELPAVDGLLAGAAEADLTPPPGMPKAGYSSNAHDGEGFRTRLRARVVHLRAGTSSLALVQCDLLGGSSVLQHLVARVVAETTDVPLAGLFIGATHTHAGPGQFLGTDFYNRFASNRSGFDPAWTQFLVDQIAGAVVDAVTTRRPAVLASGSVDVWGSTRNRSLAPHVRNHTVEDKRTEAQRKFIAVDPRLRLLRVDARAPDGGFEPLAAAVVFSVHGTGISQHAREYNADLWAYLVGELSLRIEQRHGTRAVVGAMQGNHADVAPSIRPGMAGHLEARRIGTRVGAEAARLYEALEPELTAAVTLAAGLREVDLDVSATVDGVTLPRRPAVGASLIAGATENTTPVIHRIPPFRAGSPKHRRADGPQGPKWVLGSRWLQPLLLPLRSFPRTLPVQILRIGSLAVVGMPFEITVETGRRIERAAARSLRGEGVTEVAVSSVANEYSGYAATAEEYDLQYYEGGHTLYGPRTEAFLSAHAARLARDLVRHGAVSDVGPSRSFALHVRRYLARPVGTPVHRAVAGAAGYHDATANEDGYWELQWTDVSPGDLEWHRPLVRVEATAGGDRWGPATDRGRRVDDAGWSLEVGHVGPEAEGHRYRVRWYDPVLRGDRRHRFVIEANGHQPELVSDAFD